ncbi:unnamed protein product [Caenorhabditis brenneri]
MKRTSNPTMPTIRIPGCNLHPGELPSAFLTLSPTFSPQGQPENAILKPEVPVPVPQTVKTENLQTDLPERKTMEETISNLRNQVKFLEEEKMDLQKDVDYYIKKYGHRRRRRASKRENFKIKIEEKEEGYCEKEEEPMKKAQEVVDFIPKRRRFYPPESTLEYSYKLDYIFRKSERPPSPNPHSIPIQFGQN